MYLIDTNVISEARKGSRADPGVRAFFGAVNDQDQPLYLASITIGELRRGVDLIRRRGDAAQADALDLFLDQCAQTSDRMPAAMWDTAPTPETQFA
jgi:predicted nucleic acid-binding protein